MLPQVKLSKRERLKALYEAIQRTGNGVEWLPIHDLAKQLKVETWMIAGDILDLQSQGYIATERCCKISKKWDK